MKHVLRTQLKGQSVGRKNKIVLANRGLVDSLCFVAGQSEVVIDPERKTSDVS